VAKHTVRIFKLIWMSLQDVYSMRDKEKQCVQTLKGNQGLENIVIKKENNIKMGFKEHKWSLYTRYVWL
jgi:hypothetical protein